jgi:hypothetical protein
MRLIQTHVSAFLLKAISILRCCLPLVCIAIPPTSAQVTVWTQHNDNARTGVNAKETTLKPSNVNKGQFGKLFSYTLDDQTYSQPLYMPDLTMAVDGRKHNVVFVTTVNNSVYAWDADSKTANGGHALWHVNLTPSDGRPPNVQDMDAIGACGGNYHDFAGNFGIVGTPVIDTRQKVMYLVVRAVESGSFIQRLHALDIQNGKDISGSPKEISASYDAILFDPQLQNQRAALALTNGVIYIAWSSHCDNGDYHGWVTGYRTTDLTQVAAWNDSPFDDNGSNMAGIWQGGQGATIDDRGYLYFLTGNGAWDGINNFGESAIQLTPSSSGGLRVGQYFTPHNWGDLNNGDTDLGSAGTVLIRSSGRTLLVGGGKQGMVYVMDTKAMGGYTNGGPDKVVQEFQATFIQNGGQTLHMHGGPVFFGAGPSMQYLYLWGENDFLRVFRYFPDSVPPAAPFNSTAIATSTVLAPQVGNGMPGGFLSISSNGESDAIVWALTPHTCNANQNVEPGKLFAFDATHFISSGSKQNLQLLWDSEQNFPHDDVGYFAKFTYPTVANGRVYVAGWGSVPLDNKDKCAEDAQPPAPSNEGQLSVYGLFDRGAR